MSVEAAVIARARTWAVSLKRIASLEPEDSHEFASRIMRDADAAQRDLLAAINRLPAETVTPDPLQEALL